LDAGLRAAKNLWAGIGEWIIRTRDPGPRIIWRAGIGPRIIWDAGIGSGDICAMT
jgi:hypothetical protein